MASDDSTQPSEEAKTPEVIYAEISPRSKEEGVFFTGKFEPGRLEEYRSDRATTKEACQFLVDNGFQIRQISDFTISVSGRPACFERAFGAKLRADRRDAPRDLIGDTEKATFVYDEQAGPNGIIEIESKLFDRAALNEPSFLTAELPEPPRIVDSSEPVYRGRAFDRLTLPDQVAETLYALSVHGEGIRGDGVTVVLIDSGFYHHAHFDHCHAMGKGRYDRPLAIYVTLERLLDQNHQHGWPQDPHGHGTAMAANILALAPDIRLIVIAGDVTRGGNLLTDAEMFKLAVAQKPDIICCPWGRWRESAQGLENKDDDLNAAIAEAVADDIAIVFSVGNKIRVWPNDHPDVISVGGAYYDHKGRLTVSDRSMAHWGSLYPRDPGRVVPDICGLTGPRPMSRYIMNPIPPNCWIDEKASDRSYACHDAWGSGENQHLPCPDGTGHGDGWSAFSGTSAAAAQIAGVCALIKQANPKLSRHEIGNILKETARDVAYGTTYNGRHAQPNRPDEASGHGLVDARAAVALARS